MAQYFRQQMGLGPRPATADAIAPAVVQYYVMGAVDEPGAPGKSCPQQPFLLKSKAQMPCFRQGVFAPLSRRVDD